MPRTRNKQSGEGWWTPELARMKIEKTRTSMAWMRAIGRINGDPEEIRRARMRYMQMAMDQMHMHFASAIHNSAFNVVHGYVELCFVQTHGEDPVILHKKQFRELCKFVTAESFIPCLLDLCKALWEIMKSYHKVIIWQQRNDSDKLTA
ncbi:unnamed protein product, partial [Timema podura]|nr:unnamed protein product [Timema podura]